MFRPHTHLQTSEVLGNQSIYIHCFYAYQKYDEQAERELRGFSF